MVVNVQQSQKSKRNGPKSGKICIFLNLERKRVVVVDWLLSHIFIAVFILCDSRNDAFDIDCLDAVIAWMIMNTGTLQYLSTHTHLLGFCTKKGL